jgi:hypothetical protein
MSVNTSGRRVTCTERHTDNEYQYVPLFHSDEDQLEEEERGKRRRMDLVGSRVKGKSSTCKRTAQRQRNVIENQERKVETRALARVA